MLKVQPRPATAPGDLGEAWSGRVVVGAGAALVAAHILFRAWAIYPSWFFTDDYRLLGDARGRELSMSYLLDPFDSQFMPVGRLLVWVVEQSGTTNWPLAATITLSLQAAAAFACLWMLVTLFGPRPAVLGLLALYLTSAMALPGFMWWAASLNQLPLQVVMFVAVGCWARYLTTRRASWLAATFGVLVVGLLCYVKTLLIVPVLVFLLLGYYRDGSLQQRLRTAARRDWPALLALLPIVGFAVFYALFVPQPFVAGDSAVRLGGEVAEAMLGTSLPTAAFGGPWWWWKTNPPIVLADPPMWSVHLSWVAAAGVVAYSLLRRERAGKAWLLLGGYAVGVFALLAASRGQLFGKFAGLEYRYLTDVLPVLVLAVGLAFLELRGAPGSSAPRAVPALAIATPRSALVGGLIAVTLLGVYSSWRYVQYWHHDNAGRAFVKNAQNELGRAGPTDLVSQVLPPSIMPEYTQPLNDTAQFLPLITDNARFPMVSERFHLLDGQGLLRPAVIEPNIESISGPDPDCGWRVGAGSTTIPLDGAAFDYTWQVRIGYLSSSQDDVSVRTGDVVVDAQINRGVHSLFVEVTTEFSDVTISGLSSGTTMCVDTVQVGQLVAEGS